MSKRFKPLPHHLELRRRNAAAPAPAGRFALQTQQPRYLGESAEAADAPAIPLELPITATPL
jgi:hypothetical protein